MRRMWVIKMGEDGYYTSLGAFHTSVIEVAMLYRTRPDPDDYTVGWWTKWNCRAVRVRVTVEEEEA